MGLDEIAKYIAGEWRVIAQAPVTFITVILIAIGGIWWIMSWGYGRENSFLDRQLAEYRDKLKVTTPEEAKAKIDALEKAISITIGSYWTPLTDQQIQALAAEARNIEKRRIQVMYLNAYGKDLAKTFADAFEAAGWDVDFSMGGGFEGGVFVGRSRSTSIQLKEAIEKTTPFTPEIMGREDEEYGPQGSVFVAVGVNTK